MMEIEDKALMPALHGVAEHSGAPATAREGLRLGIRLMYGVGEISNSLKTFVFGLFLLFFYTSVLGLPGTLVGIAVSLGLVWDALIDPLIGHASDRARLRFGRRHSFMLAGGLSMGITFLAIFSPPAGLGQWGLFAWLMGSSLLFRSSSSLFVVPYHALGAELSRNYHERTAVTGTRAAFALLGSLLAAVSAFTLFFPNTTPGVDPKFNLAGYSQMGLAFGVTMMLVSLVATAGTFAYHKQTITPAHDKGPGLGHGLRLVTGSRPFLVLTCAATLFYLGSVINALVGIHFLTYYVQITRSNQISLFQFTFYAGAIGGVFVWLQVARRVDKHRLFLGAALVTALIMGAAYWLVGAGRLFGVGNIMPLVIGNAVAGFFASALWAVTPSMIADITDHDALVSGQRREGAFFGIYSFVQQLGAGLATLLAGVLIDHFAGLIPGEVAQMPLTVERIGVLFSMLPALFLVVSALIMLGYGLSHRRVTAIQTELARREQGERIAS